MKILMQGHDNRDVTNTQDASHIVGLEYCISWSVASILF